MTIQCSIIMFENYSGEHYYDDVQLFHFLYFLLIKLEYFAVKSHLINANTQNMMVKEFGKLICNAFIV